MTGDRTTGAQSTDAPSEQAARHTLALDPIVGFRSADLVGSAGVFFKAMIKEPQVAANQWLAFVGELGDILRGASERSPTAADKRFADPAWKSSPLHSGLLKAYLAWGEALDGFVDRTSLGKVDKERAHLFATILIDALAPTNSLLANPVATRRLIETGGQSLLSGLSNYLDDLIKNGGLPSQVDMSAFKVGENLATTPGGVVFRNDLIELIQYEPTTAAVSKRPLVITPPQINKFYALDLSPEKSLIRFLVKNGIQVFAVSWRNPTTQHRDWGLDTYVAALDEAVERPVASRAVEDVSMMGSCSGGITACAYVSTLGLDKIRNLVLAVCLLDTKTLDDSAFGSLITPETMLAAKEASRTARSPGRTRSCPDVRLDAAERPHLELLGEQLSSRQCAARVRHPLLERRHDPTAGPAARRLHRSLRDQPLRQRGRAFPQQSTRRHEKVKGRVDAYVVAGVTDHITPWKSVFQTARILGDDARFILSNSGHLQSLINPPGARKASFRIGSATSGGPDAFLSEAEQCEGSWWLDGLDWLRPRSGPDVDAPKSLGDDAHPVLAPAPGSYVFER